MFYSIGLAPLFGGFLQASSAVQFFGSDNVCCPKRELSVVLLGFKLLSVALKSPNLMIYAMSKFGTATSGLI